MDEPQPPSLQAELRQLLAIPERERTDAQWERLNEIEIQLASVNLKNVPPRPAPRPGRADHGGQARKFHRKPGRPG